MVYHGGGGGGCNLTVIFLPTWRQLLIDWHRQNQYSQTKGSVYSNKHKHEKRKYHNAVSSHAASCSTI